MVVKGQLLQYLKILERDLHMQKFQRCMNSIGVLVSQKWLLRFSDFFGSNDKT